MARVPLDIQIYRIIVVAPEAPADPLLPQGMDHYGTVAVPDRLLDMFFQYTRGNTLTMVLP